MAKSKIYFTTFSIGWQKGWRILRDENNKPFTSMEKAIAFIRETKAINVGLADKSQMKINNAEWDNL